MARAGGRLQEAAAGVYVFFVLHVSCSTALRATHDA